jgi:hypothetical protein
VGERIMVTIGGETIGVATIRALTPDGLPKPKPILSHRARKTAIRTFLDRPSPNMVDSLEAALAAAVGIIAADNVDTLASGIEASMPTLLSLGQTSHLMVLVTVAEMLREYIECVDPDRPDRSG